MTACETYLKNVGISFQWHIGKDSKKLEYRDLTGPEKPKLSKNIKNSSLLNNETMGNQVQNLWAGFMDIIENLKLDFHCDTEIMQLKTKIKAGSKLFFSSIKQRTWHHICMP